MGAGYSEGREDSNDINSRLYVGAIRVCLPFEGGRHTNSGERICLV